MKNRKLILTLLICFVLQSFNLQAQDGISALGGNGIGSGGSISYSAGQLGYLQYSGLNGSIIQGLQQPYEISVLNNNNHKQNITLNCSVFPNPTSDILVLAIDNYNELDGDLSYLLFDNTGKLIQNKKIVNNETRVHLTDLISSLYFLKVIDGNRGFITFKILKK